MISSVGQNNTAVCYCETGTSSCLLRSVMLSVGPISLSFATCLSQTANMRGFRIVFFKVWHFFNSALRAEKKILKKTSKNNSKSFKLPKIIISPKTFKKIRPPSGGQKTPNTQQKTLFRISAADCRPCSAPIIIINVNQLLQKDDDQGATNVRGRNYSHHCSPRCKESTSAQIFTMTKQWWYWVVR